MGKTDEYKVPDSVKNDDVAMWASEEDLLIYSHFYDKGRAEALNSQWVNVKDRLPEKDQIVLCFHDGEVFQAHIQIIYSDGYAVFKQPNASMYGANMYNIPVTHWQAISPPPKP